MEIRIYTVAPLGTRGGGYLVVHPNGPDISGIDPRVLGETWYVRSIEEAIRKVVALLVKKVTLLPSSRI